MASWASSRRLYICTAEQDPLSTCARRWSARIGCSASLSDSQHLPPKGTSCQAPSENLVLYEFSGGNQKQELLAFAILWILKGAE